MQPVLDTIIYVKNETNIELELTTLLIPDENDDEDILKKEFEWIVNNLSDDIPIHLSAFHPSYKMLNKSRTNPEILINAYNIAKKSGLKFVYTGNILNVETSTTSCPNCKLKLIERNGYNVKVLVDNPSICPNCGTKIYGKIES